jgi:uncharacterized protein (TIGR03435 family)
MKLVLAITLAIQFAIAQTPKSEFEAASLKPAAPQTGHFPAAPASKGGPGTPDPALFRCTNCNLAFLITRAYDLQRYQLPGQPSLPDQTFDLTAKIPEGTTAEQFATMLQNLLKDRFNLATHFETKQVQGYELVVAKNGPPMKPVAANAPAQPPADDWHSRRGLMFFNGQGTWRGDHQTTADLARMISTQLMKPVEDHTNLTGAYDITLTWTDDGAHAATHPAGGYGGGFNGGHDHGADTTAGPTLIGALQSQLGLKLESKRATAQILIVDHADKTFAAN